jgi:ceramide glucosyltransferase
MSFFLAHHWYELVPLVPALGGLAYQFLILAAVWKFFQLRRDEKPPSRTAMPPISILKPIKGYDPEAYESFRSHCLLDYPEYEIIFGLSHAKDAAAPLIEQLRREFPQRRIELVVCSQNLGMNPKTSKVLQMMPVARYDYLVINDGDIRVEKDYLQHLMRGFRSKQIGMVTCLYSASASHSIGSKLEALSISTDFAPGVLAARALEGGLHFGLGATIAVSRSMLDTIGGLESLVDYLAEDYVLGARVAQAGFKVEVSDQSVRTFLPAYTWAEFFRHQLRLARGIRDSRPWGYLGSGVTYVIPWALLTALVAGGAPWSLLLLALAVVMRFASAVTVAAGVLHDRQIWRDFWLLPLRDCVAAILWLVSFAGHSVTWRNTEYVLRDGKLLPKTTATTESRPQPPISCSSPKQ